MTHSRRRRIETFKWPSLWSLPNDIPAWGNGGSTFQRFFREEKAYDDYFVAHLEELLKNSEMRPALLRSHTPI